MTDIVCRVLFDFAQSMHMTNWLLIVLPSELLSGLNNNYGVDAASITFHSCLLIQHEFRVQVPLLVIRNDLLSRKAKMNKIYFGW